MPKLFNAMANSSNISSQIHKSPSSYFVCVPLMLPGIYVGSHARGSMMCL